MAQRVAEHAAIGVLVGSMAAVALGAVRLRRIAGWAEMALVGGCSAAAFTIVDGQPTNLAWSAGVAVVAALLYAIGVEAIAAASVRRVRPTRNS